MDPKPQSPRTDPPVRLPERLVLFDGVCGMCNGVVRWMLRRDPPGRLRFAPLQGPAADAVRAMHPHVPELTTAVYVTGAGQNVFLGSEAVLRAIGELKAPWCWLSLLRFVPRVLSDAVYGLVVRNRYSVAGQYDACPLPTPDEAARFLA